MLLGIHHRKGMVCDIHSIKGGRGIAVVNFFACKLSSYQFKMYDYSFRRINNHSNKISIDHTTKINQKQRHVVMKEKDINSLSYTENKI